MAPTLTITIRLEGADLNPEPEHSSGSAADWVDGLAGVLARLTSSLDMRSPVEPDELDGWQLHDINGNNVGAVTFLADTGTRRRPELDDKAPWADLLEQLTTMSVGQAADLKVDRDGIRVWLSRGDEHPFPRTVYVEQLTTRSFGGTAWTDVGHFDGDVHEPAPASPADRALTYTLDAVWEAS